MATMHYYNKSYIVTVKPYGTGLEYYVRMNLIKTARALLGGV